MPAGLRVWDAGGNLQVDTTTFLGRYLGQAQIGPGTDVITNDQFLQGIPWCVPILDGVSPVNPDSNSSFGFYDTNLYLTAPTWSFSGNQLRWSRPPASVLASLWSYPTCTLVYGVR